MQVEGGELTAPKSYRHRVIPVHLKQYPEMQPNHHFRTLVP